MSWAKVKKINSDMSTPLDKLVGRIERYNPGFSGATLSNCERNASGDVIISAGQTTATVTEDIAVSSLQQWYKYHRNTTEPANTSVTCAIKDTSDNVLIASVTDGDSLSAIDAKTYKTIRLVHTLTRNSVSDATPKLHYREVSWIGKEDFIYNKANMNGYSAYANNNTTTNMLVGEYTGRGIASLAILKLTGGNSICTITLDGVEYTVTLAYVGANYYPVLSDLSGTVNSNFAISTGTDTVLLISKLAFPIVFKQSLKVEIKSNDAYNAIALLYTEVEK